MSAPLRLGLVHTAPPLVDLFDRLAHEENDVELVHLVDPSLLARAIRGGVTPALTQRVVEHVGYLVGLGMDGVLVTCSSIGQCADRAHPQFDVPVLRVDRPMAARAVELASVRGARHCVSVLATLTSTLGPTQRLLAEQKGRVGAPVSIRASVVRGAAERRLAGDVTGHDERVRAAVAAQRGSVDVVVLAQASMAQALISEDEGRAEDEGSAEHEGGTDDEGSAESAQRPVPVLSSPASGLAAALAAARAHRAGALERDRR